MNLMDFLRTLGVHGHGSAIQGGEGMGYGPKPGATLAGAAPTMGGGLSGAPPPAAPGAPSLATPQSLFPVAPQLFTAPASAPTEGPQPLAKQAAGSIDTPPAGPSWQDRLQMIGSTLQDLGDIGLGREGGHFDKSVAEIKAQSLLDAQMAARQRVVSSGALGNDPALANAYLYSPEATDKAIAERLLPRMVGRNDALYMDPNNPNAPPITNTGVTAYGNNVYADTGAHAGEVVNTLPMSATDRAALTNADTGIFNANTGRYAAQTGRAALGIPDYRLGGATADGHPYLYDSKSGNQLFGPTPVQTIPSGRQTNYDKMYAIGIANNMDPVGAAQFASGRGYYSAASAHVMAEKTIANDELTRPSADDAEHAQRVADVEQAILSRAGSGMPPTDPAAPPVPDPQGTGAGDHFGRQLNPPPAPPPPPGPTAGAPGGGAQQRFLDTLQEGVYTTSTGGQVWTKQHGKAVRIR